MWLDRRTGHIRFGMVGSAFFCATLGNEMLQRLACSATMPATRLSVKVKMGRLSAVWEALCCIAHNGSFRNKGMRAVEHHQDRDYLRRFATLLALQLLEARVACQGRLARLLAFLLCLFSP